MLIHQRLRLYLDRVLRDIRFGLRELVQRVGFTAAAVLSLALGIGATTAVFSIADPLLLRTLPVRTPEELVLFRMPSTTEAQDVDSFVSYELFDRLGKQNETLSGVFLSGSLERMTLNTQGVTAVEGRRAEVWVEPVSGGYFGTLGVQPAAGRMLTEMDDRAAAAPVAVISYGLWQRRFGRDPSIIGEGITLNDRPYTIIGVTPKRFYGIDIDSHPDVWLPFQPYAIATPVVMLWLRYLPHAPGPIRMMARLRPGVGVEQTRAEADIVHRQITTALADDFVATDLRARIVRVEDGAAGFSELRVQFAEPLLILVAAVVAVLLLACANVAALLLARGMARQKEIAMRLAMGSPRVAIIQQLLIENLILSALACIVGIGMAYWGTELLLSYLPPESGLLANVGMDNRALRFAVVASILSALSVGLVPALRASRLNVWSALKEQSSDVVSGQSQSVALRLIVVLQIAGAMILLVGAGLFLRTLQNLRGVDTGFDKDNVVQFSVESQQGTSNWSEFVRNLLSQLQTIPEVESATYYGMRGLLNEVPTATSVKVVGMELNAALQVSRMEVGPSFFKTTGISLLAGREFQANDETNTELEDPVSVAVVGEDLARQLFGLENAIGQRIQDGDDHIEIIGVAARAIHDDPRVAGWALYRFLSPSGPTRTRFAVRLLSGSSNAISIIEGTVPLIDDRFHATNIQTMREVTERIFGRERFVANLVAVLGLVAMLLAVGGIYGLFSYAAAQRTREIGIRLALGARRQDVLLMMLRETMVIAAAGITFGLVGASATTRLASNLLFGLTPTDPSTIGLAAILFVLAAVAAGYIPARRASRVNPLVTLRGK